MAENDAIAVRHLHPDPVLAGSERATLVEFLDYYRDVLIRKAAGLTQHQLAARLGPSELSIGGLVKHMATVEDGWFHQGWSGHPPAPPWDAVDWAADRDWDHHSAADDRPAELERLFDDAVARSRASIATSHDLDATAEINGRSFSLRWILVHMIEEYARHCGHADLLRESIDGATGD